MKRYEFLKQLINENKFLYGAELGVQEGITFKYLVDNCPNLFLYGVDIFAPKTVRWIEDVDIDSYDIPDRNKPIFEFAVKRLNRCKLYRGLTSTMHTNFEDNQLDFIFIDASHEKEDVKLDIELWEPKVRSGGMIAGHDINMLGVSMSLAELSKNYQTGPDNVWFYTKE